jgi:uncharacterized protein (TIGR03382 family)
MTSLVLLAAALTANPHARHFLTDHPAAAQQNSADGHLTHASGFLADTGARDAETAARSFLADYEGEFGIGNDGLELRGMPQAGKSGAVKFARTLNGMQLFGGEVTVGVDEKHRVFLVNAGSGAGTVSGSHLIGETAAHQAALEAVASSADAGEGTIVQGYRNFLGQTRAVYRVDFINTAGDWRSFVDGETGKVLLRQNLRSYATAPGSVYEVSPVEDLASLCPLAANGSHTICKTPTSVTVLNLVDTTKLVGTQTQTFNCDGKNQPTARSGLTTCAQILPQNGGFALPVDSAFTSKTDDFSAVMAYVHLDEHVTFFKTLDPTLPPADTTDPGHPLAIRGSMPGLVNNLSGGKPLENAFFSGSLDAMVFGQGATSDYSYDATVMYHEYTHGVVFAWGGYGQDIVALGGFDESSALNEGTADSMAVSETGHSEIGAFIGAKESTPAETLRDMNDPNANRSCQGNGTQVSQFGFDGVVNGFDGEVHDDGEIWNGFYWEVFAGLSSTSFTGCSGNCQAAPEIMYKTIQLAAGGDGPKFANYWQTFKAAATTLQPTQPSVAAYVDCVARRRGFDKCDSTVPLFAGEAKAQFIRLRYSPFQVAVHVSAAAVNPNTANLFLCDTQGLQFTIYANKDSPVTLSSIDPNTGNATVTASEGHITISGATCSGGGTSINFAGSPAGTYFLLVDAPGALESASPGQDVVVYQAGLSNGTGLDTTGFAPRPAGTAPATCTPPAPFAITQPAATIGPRGKLTLASTGGTNTGVTWSITTNNSGGSIVASTGAYTAGATPNVTDTVKAADSLGDSATQTVAVGPGVTLTPPSATVASGGTMTFVASGGSGTFTWSVSPNASGGNVDATGKYKAGGSAGADTVVATDSNGNTASAAVTVTGGSGGGGGCASTDAGFAALFAGLAVLLQARRRRVS